MRGRPGVRAFESARSPFYQLAPEGAAVVEAAVASAGLIGSERVESGLIRSVDGRPDRSDKTCPDAIRPTSPFCYLTYFNEIVTILTAASPMLSDATPSTSATAMCTMRRSYEFSGPIS